MYKQSVMLKFILVQVWLLPRVLSRLMTKSTFLKMVLHFDHKKLDPRLINIDDQTLRNVSQLGYSGDLLIFTLWNSLSDIQGVLFVVVFCFS